MSVVILRLETETVLQITYFCNTTVGIVNAKCVHSEKCAKNATNYLRCALKTDHEWSGMEWNDGHFAPSTNATLATYRTGFNGFKVLANGSIR